MHEKVIIITGCLGFIGSHFTELCLKNGWWVIGIDKCTYASNTYLIDEFKKNERFSFIKSDIKDLEYLPESDYIVNFAAESHVENSIIDSGHFMNSNILGVKNLLELVRLKPINSSYRPIFIQISTDEVYGDIKSGSHLETDILTPSNPYSASKAAADMLVMAWARTYDLKYIMMRPTNNYGPRQFPEKLIPVAIRNLRRGLKTKLHNGGEPIRNWLHAEDTSSAIMTVINSKVENEIYNIAGGFEQSNKETVRKIIKEFNGSEDWEQYVDFGYTRAGQDVRYSLCDDKLRNLGWKPQKIFDHELKSIVKHYKDNFRL